MVYVRLEQEWTDGEGATHDAGSMIEVDAATLAELEESGVVAEPGPGGGGGASTDSGGGWAGPTGGGGASTDSGGGWAGPTGGGGT